MLLEQQELLEVAPPRSVVLPPSARGSAGWWGVDSSTSRFNVGWVDQHLRRGVESVRLGRATDNDGERLARFYRQLRLLIETMLDEGIVPPAVVFVEQPSGVHVHPVMLHTVGVALACSYETINARCGWVPRVELVPPGTWKAKAVGRGNIGKPPRPKGAPPPPTDAYPVWVWARTLGLPQDGSWDDADAYGIAECARRTIGIAG